MQKRNPYLRFLSKNASWRSILILLGLIILINVSLLLLLQSSNNLVLDLQFSYSTERAYEILANYSTIELNNYIITELTVDMVYPIIYSLFFSFFIWKLSERKILPLLPFLILIADYCENIGIVSIINQLPEQAPNIVTLTSFFTSLKWTLVAITIVIIIGLSLFQLKTRRKLN